MPERPAAATPATGAATARRALPVLPGYEIRGVLGRGGMGVVYQARHLKLNRIVALKMILTGSYAGEEELARFQAEAAAVARLQHANIVQIFDVGEHAEAGGPTHPFMALEYVPGGTLAGRVATSPLSPREAAAVVETLARAMHYAHQRGVVHRDLKPANVLLAADGTPKITDFGLAKTLDADGGQTQTGQVMGTPEYMAPEQAAGLVRAIGPATDVYALGTILYALLAGRPPFRAASLTETLDQVRHREPVPPGQVQAGLSRDLDTICLKCLQKEPRKRYAGAEELAEDLRRFLAGEPIKARPVGRAERMVRWCRRYPFAASLMALLGLFLLVAAGGWATALRESDAKEFQRARAEENEQKEREQRLKTEEAQKSLQKQIEEKIAALHTSLGYGAIADLEAALEKAAKDEATNANAKLRRLLAYTQVMLAAQSEFNNNLELAQQTLDEVPLPLRGWEWHYLHRQCAGGVRVLRGHTSPVMTLTFGADGRRLLTVDQNRAARVWDTAGGAEPFATIPFGFSALSMRPAGHVLRPDGRVLLVQIPFRVPQLTPEWEVARLRDLDTGKDVCSLKAPNHTQVMRFVFSPDGKRVAGSCQSFEDRLRLWDAQSGRLIKTLPGNAREVKDLAFSPDGRLIATLGIDNGNKGELKLWDVEQGKDIFTYTGELFLFLTNEAAMTTFSPDGKYLVACGKGSPRGGNETVKDGVVQFTGLLKVWEVPSGKEVSLADAPEWAASCVFSPDSRSLAVLGGDGTTRVLDLATGKQEINVAGWGAEIPYRQALAFSPDGNLLALAGGYTVRVWDRKRKAQVLDLRGHSSAVAAVTFSLDGRRLASGGGDNLVRLWDLDEARRPRFLRDDQNTLDHIALSPGGELLVTSGHALSGAAFRRVKLWKTAGGELVRTLHAPDEDSKPRPAGTFAGAGAHAIRCFALSPDGKRIATGEAQGVTFWDVAGGSRLRSITIHNTTRERPSSGGVSDVAFSPDGKHVASTGGDGTVQVWNPEDGEPIFEWTEERTIPNTTTKTRMPGWSVAWSGDGKRLVAGYPDRCRVFDVVTSRQLCTIDRAGPVILNPAGTLVFTGGPRPEIGVWEAADGKHLFDLKGHFAAVTGLAFTPDGSRLASSSGDGTVKLWDLTMRREVLTLRGPQGVALGVAFSADGNRLVSAHGLYTGKIGIGPGEVRIWDARPLTPPAPAPARR